MPMMATSAGRRRAAGAWRRAPATVAPAAPVLPALTRRRAARRCVATRSRRAATWPIMYMPLLATAAPSSTGDELRRVGLAPPTRGARSTPLDAIRSRPRFSASSAVAQLVAGDGPRARSRRFSSSNVLGERASAGSGSRGPGRSPAARSSSPATAASWNVAAIAPCSTASVGEEVRGAHQHADAHARARPAAPPAPRPSRPRARRGCRRRSRTWQSRRAGAAARSSSTSTIVSHSTKLVRGPTWPPHSRPSKTKRRAPSRQEQLQQPGRGHVQVGRDALVLERAGLVRPAAGDQRERRAVRADRPRAARRAARAGRSRGCRRPRAGRRASARRLVEQRVDLRRRASAPAPGTAGRRPAATAAAKLGAVADARHRPLDDRVARAVRLRPAARPRRAGSRARARRRTCATRGVAVRRRCRRRCAKRRARSAANAASWPISQRAARRRSRARRRARPAAPPRRASSRRSAAARELRGARRRRVARRRAAASPTRRPGPRSRCRPCARSGRARRSGSGDSRASSSCPSSTTPAAPATQAAATLWRPMPPCAQTGRSQRVEQALQQDERALLADPAAGLVALGDDPVGARRPRRPAASTDVAVARTSQARGVGRARRRRRAAGRGPAPGRAPRSSAAR